MEKLKTIGILASAVLLVSAHIAPALADENSWSTGGPYGASVMDIALHPSDTLRMFMGTVDSGIFETTDGGAEWSINEDDTLDTCIRRIRIHPLGPDTMYASTANGIFKSTDAGQSWFRLPLPYPENENRPLEIHPDNPSILFSGDMGGPLKSTDGGASWYKNDGGIPVMTNVDDIKIDPVNTNIVYFTGGADYKSEDYGENWNWIRPDPYETGTGGQSIAIDPVNTEIVYFGRYDHRSIGTCLYKSTNGGSDWMDITPPELVIGRVWVNEIVVSPFDHNMVFIVTMEHGIFRSPDGGRYWEEINEGLIIRTAWRMVFDPRTGSLYLGTFHDGIYRSTNNGDSWQKISYNVTGVRCTDIAANWRDPDTLYTATKAGIFISTDGAESWERIILDRPYHELICSQLEVDPYDPSYVYSSLFFPCSGFYDGAFYRSTDGGSTWESFTAGLPSNTNYYRIAVADYYGSGWRRLFMGTSAGLYYSDDLGESWLLCRGGLPPDINCNALGVSPVNPDIVLVAKKYSYDFYKSADGGITWELLNIPRGRGKEIACDPVDEDIIYVIMYPEIGIFKSTDGGQTWDNIDNNLPRDDYFYVSGIAINPLNHDNVFVFLCSKGPYESHDGGQTWQEFLYEGLRKGGSATTLIDPVDTSRVFLAQVGQSVWEITRTQTGIDDKENVLPVAFSSSSYPNPFNPSATIEYSLPEAAFVTVDIYDLLGRKVERLVGEDQEAGRYQLVWNAEDRASGLYFYRIDAGESSEMKKMILLK